MAPLDATMSAPRQLASFRPLAVLCLLLIAGGAALPFVRLGAAPFWVDESIAALPARSIHSHGVPTSPFDLDFMPWQLEYGLWDPATPLYRYSLAAYTAVVGFSEWTARSFSVLAGLAAALPLFLLARRLYDEQIALLTVTFFLVSPTFVIFAREARHPTFLLGLSVWTLLFLHRSAAAAPGHEGRAPLLAFVCLVATLLSQTLGYLILPIAGVYLLLNGPRRFFHRRHAGGLVLVGGIQLAILALFWHTLPFFHEVSCTNRTSGCNPDPFYYLGVLNDFLAPGGERHPQRLWQVFSLTPLLLVVGLASSLRRDLADEGWRQRCLLLLWLFLPLLLLSLREVKFPRYLFIWSHAPAAVLLALGVAAAVRRRPLGRLEGWLAAALVLLVVAAPQLRRDAAGWRLESGLFRYVRNELIDAPRDNWERVAWTAQQLRDGADPGDIIVTSFDDASLQYELGRFVHGFLNSRHDDAYFLGLLERAEAEGVRVWFVDTLPHWNFCLTDEAAPRNVDCRVKYREFYRRCLEADRHCRRLPVRP